MPNQRTSASYAPKSHSSADCTSIGIHWEERKPATSIWICCSDSSSVKPQLEASNIIFWDMQSPTVSPTATFTCYCRFINTGCAVLLFLDVCWFSLFTPFSIYICLIFPEDFILSLDFRYPFSPNQVAPPLDWEQYVSEIATDILSEQSPKRFVMFLFCWAGVPNVNLFSFLFLYTCFHA